MSVVRAVVVWISGLLASAGCFTMVWIMAGQSDGAIPFVWLVGALVFTCARLWRFEHLVDNALAGRLGELAKELSE